MLDLTNDELGRKNGLIWPSLFMHNALLAKSENEVTHLLTWQNTRLSSVHWNWLKRLWAWRLNWPAFKDMKTWTQPLYPLVWCRESVLSNSGFWVNGDIKKIHFFKSWVHYFLHIEISGILLPEIWVYRVISQLIISIARSWCSRGIFTFFLLIWLKTTRLKCK